MHNIFTQHPHSINETYFQHLKFAFCFGSRMLLSALACMIHAVFPFLFEKTGSKFLLNSTRELIERTPILDERMLVLAEIIQRKKADKV
jgi:hypothetical protein